MTTSKKQPPRVRPWEQTGDGDVASFGTWLRRQREAREISLREISEASKISMRYLEALEDDRFEVLPAPVFARGFLREYSKVVGLNGDDVVNNYISALGQDETGEETGGAESERIKGRAAKGDWGYGVVLSVALALLLGLVALLAFWAERRRETAPPPATAIAPPPMAPAPAPAPPVAPRPQADAPLRVTLDFVDDCWIEIASDGKPRASELRVRGESVEIEAKEFVVLTLGKPAGVKVEVNGHPYALQAPAGKVLHDLRIDLDTAKGLGG